MVKRHNKETIANARLQLETTYCGTAPAHLENGSRIYDECSERLAEQIQPKKKRGKKSRAFDKIEAAAKAQAAARAK